MFSVFSLLSDDVVLNILEKLEDDPRHWARLACVSPKFRSLILNICIKNKCLSTVPSIATDLLLTTTSQPPGGWASLFNIAVSCPGLRHAGVLLEHSDFGLELHLGSGSHRPDPAPTPIRNTEPPAELVTNCAWSMFDDLYFDTVYDDTNNDNGCVEVEDCVDDRCVERGVFKRVKKNDVRFVRAHLSSMVWSFSREQGHKLLASRFRGDCLYICDWPGCVHIEEKRNYMLFRGVFKNFKQSRVWRTIKDGNKRSKIDIGCAFCECKETWDLHSAFCLRRVFGFHDDGEPVVRAYVCENGHVSGAWTDFPLYT